MSDNIELNEIYLKGKKMLFNGDFVGAKQAFSLALEKKEHIEYRNDLARTLLLDNEPDKALEVLNPALENPDPDTLAIASQIYQTNGQNEKAHEYLEQALSSSHFSADAWQEHAASILSAAGNLGKDEQVYELYNQLDEKNISWHAKYYAAIACFNMERYQEASNIWISLDEIKGLGEEFSAAVEQIQEGVIPSFRLDYKLYTPAEIDRMYQRYIQEEGKDKGSYKLLENSFIKMMLLGKVFGPNNEQEHMEGSQTPGSASAGLLINYGGKWGQKVGQAILKAPGIPGEIRMTAMQCLVDLGVYEQEKQEESTKIILEPDEDMKEAMKKAREYYENGQSIEAVKILRKAMKEGKYTPAAVIELAGYLHMDGRLEEAEKELLSLEDVIGNDFIFLANMTVVKYHKGEIKEAREYFDRINPKEVTEENQGQYLYLKKSLEDAERS